MVDLENYKSQRLHAHLGWGIDFKELQTIVVVEQIDEVEKRTKFIR